MPGLSGAPEGGAGVGVGFSRRPVGAEVEGCAVLDGAGVLDAVFDAVFDAVLVGLLVGVAGFGTVSSGRGGR